jgi:hypothetical protein
MSSGSICCWINGQKTIISRTRSSPMALPRTQHHHDRDESSGRAPTRSMHARSVSERHRDSGFIRFHTCTLHQLFQENIDNDSITIDALSSDESAYVLYKKPCSTEQGLCVNDSSRKLLSPTACSGDPGEAKEAEGTGCRHRGVCTECIIEICKLDISRIGVHFAPGIRIIDRARDTEG